MLSIQQPPPYGVLAGPERIIFQKNMFSSLGNTSNAWEEGGGTVHAVQQKGT